MEARCSRSTLRRRASDLRLLFAELGLVQPELRVKLRRRSGKLHEPAPVAELGPLKGEIDRSRGCRTQRRRSRPLLPDFMRSQCLIPEDVAPGVDAELTGLESALQPLAQKLSGDN
jgi:hypothetical protein